MCIRDRDSDDIRRRQSTRQKRDGELCVICNNKKYKGDLRLLRICEKERAEKFLTVTHHFQEDVFSRVSILDDVESVFAADVLYHKLCMTNYLSKYSRNVEQFETLIQDSNVTTGFQKLLDKLDLSENGYELSDLTSFMNSECELESLLSNRQMKNLLIKHFGEEIAFTYPKERSKSQIVHFANISVSKTIQRICSTNSLKDITDELARELKQYDFQLDDKFCEDVYKRQIL